MAFPLYFFEKRDFIPLENLYFCKIISLDNFFFVSLQL